MIDANKDFTEEQEEKLTEFRECFITSPNLDMLLKLIHRSRRTSKCGGASENMIITGDPGAGKSTLKERYRKLHPHVEESERTCIKVFSSEFPAKATPKAIAMQVDLGA